MNRNINAVRKNEKIESRIGELIDAFGMEPLFIELPFAYFPCPYSVEKDKYTRFLQIHLKSGVLKCINRHYRTMSAKLNCCKIIDIDNESEEV